MKTLVRAILIASALILSVGGWVAAWVVNRLAADDRRVYAADVEAARSQIGSACEPIYGAWWVDYKCAGLFGGFVPPGLSALACPQTIQVYRSGRQADVLSRVAALGPGRTLLGLEERGARERAFPISWRPEIK